MAKVIRLTESDLVRLVKKVINEQKRAGGPPKYNPVKAVGTRQPIPSGKSSRGMAFAKRNETPNNPQVVPCSSIGIKSPGDCEKTSKRPIQPCSNFGVKTVGYCYTDTKQPASSIKPVQ